MDKQKQIEEMAKDLKEEKLYALINKTSYMRSAENLYDLGYRKIPEGAVVLTREEYDELQIGKDFNYGVHSGESNMTEYYENIRLPEVRKETAEKFAERLKEIANDKLGLYGWQMVDIIDIDEIYKELTEGKV